MTSVEVFDPILQFVQRATGACRSHPLPATCINWIMWQVMARAYRRNVSTESPSLQGEAAGILADLCSGFPLLAPCHLRLSLDDVSLVFRLISIASAHRLFLDGLTRDTVLCVLAAAASCTPPAIGADDCLRFLCNQPFLAAERDNTRQSQIACRFYRAEHEIGAMGWWALTSMCDIAILQPPSSTPNDGLGGTIEAVGVLHCLERLLVPFMAQAATGCMTWDTAANRYMIYSATSGSGDNRDVSTRRSASHPFVWLHARRCKNRQSMAAFPTVAPRDDGALQEIVVLNFLDRPPRDALRRLAWFRDAVLRAVVAVSRLKGDRREETAIPPSMTLGISAAVAVYVTCALTSLELHQLWTGLPITSVVILSPVTAARLVLLAQKQHAPAESDPPPSHTVIVARRSQQPAILEEQHHDAPSAAAAVPYGCQAVTTIPLQQASSLSENGRSGPFFRDLALSGLRCTAGFDGDGGHGDVPTLMEATINDLSFAGES